MVQQSPVTQSPVIWFQVPGTGHESSSHWSVRSDYQELGTRHQAFNHQAPVTSQPVTSQLTRHRSSGISRWVLIYRSSEQSLLNEPQNFSTSKRVLWPLEPDVNQMSDPSIIINLPSNTWQSVDRHTSQSRQTRWDRLKTKHKSKKRRRHRSSSFSSSSRSSTASHI